MATAVQTRQTSSKSEAYLDRKFAEVAARIHRIDLIAHLLVLVLISFAYALSVVIFDSIIGAAEGISIDVARWSAFAAFGLIFAYALLRSLQCAVSEVNPYYVAQLIEQTIPDGKNGLINWLDLHDETMPSAFQKNLSGRAAEQWKDADIEQSLSAQGNGWLLGIAALPALGLAVFMFLNPPAFGGSLLRAFLPWYAPPPAALTRITLLQPTTRTVEVKAKQSLHVVAKIDGRVPSGDRPDAPRLWHRNQATEDFQAQLLRQDSDGNWVGQLSEKQIGLGAVYKLTAGDAETPEQSVRLRADTHVKKYEVTYHLAPYRKLPRTTTSEFPNALATHPIIAGPRGTKVQLVVHPSRAVKTAIIETDIAGKQRSNEMQRHGNATFAHPWTLEQPGRFRILFEAADGEPNVDRDWRPIVIEPDDAPAVVLTSPASDITLPENAVLELEGLATSRVGIRNATLHLRIVGDPSRPLAPVPYRPAVSFQGDDGTFANEVPYFEVVPLDQLKNSKGTIILPKPGDEIEYWLEAMDAADYHNGAGNVGRTPTPNRKVKIVAPPKDPNAAREQLAKNHAAQAKKKNFDRQQDQARSQERNNGSNTKAGNQPSAQQQLDQTRKDNEAIDQKIKQALDQQNQNQGRGDAKEREQPAAKAKDGPSGASDAPQPQPKDNPGKDDAGVSKDQGKGMGGAGQPRDNGEPTPKKDESSKGDRKDGPPMSAASSAKDAGPMGMPEPAGGSKDAGPTGMNTPMPTGPKDQPGDPGPLASAKDSKDATGPAQPPGDAKGIEQNGPQPVNKDTAANDGQPGAASKAGMMPDAADAPKSGPNPQTAGAASPGSVRGDDAKKQNLEPTWSDLAKAIEQLANHDVKGDDAGAIVALLAESAPDPRMKDIAKEALKQNGRDLKTGKEEKKAPNAYGSSGKSPGVSDDIKAIAANREFLARINQLQFDDWNKLVTPDVLKRAGISEADWQKRLKSNQQYRDLVRELNTMLFKEAAQKELRGSATAGGGYRPEAVNPQSTLDAAGRSNAPTIFRDAQRRYDDAKKK